MSNWNLDNFDNIYASLAQSAYTGRPIEFPYEKLSPDQRKALDSGESVRFDFSKDKTFKGQVTQGASGDGYPDKSDPNASKTELYLQPDETLHTTKDGHQKGLLTDEKEGFNAYYVTDTQKVDGSTKNTYFVVRGSDGMGMDTLNDWIGNDAKFAVTGHSLGTIVSAQAVANLSYDEFV
ncbi:triacylglycerol lipase [Streptococcus dentapri]|uniref:Triacylglycerol lipase n=1 Tax=Streptococcus dentapri TaxID=573564 RepID=A0ABV8D343_9STRE